MDLINTNSELHEIENELAKLHEKRIDAGKSLAELIEKRIMKENNVHKIENEIAKQKAQNDETFHSMVFFFIFWKFYRFQTNFCIFFSFFFNSLKDLAEIFILINHFVYICCPFI